MRRAWNTFQMTRKNYMQSMDERVQASALSYKCTTHTHTRSHTTHTRAYSIQLIFYIAGCRCCHYSHLCTWSSKYSYMIQYKKETSIQNVTGKRLGKKKKKTLNNGSKSCVMIVIRFMSNCSCRRLPMSTNKCDLSSLRPPLPSRILQQCELNARILDHPQLYKCKGICTHIHSTLNTVTVKCVRTIRSNLRIDKSLYSIG